MEKKPIKIEDKQELKDTELENVNGGMKVEKKPPKAIIRDKSILKPNKDF